MDDTDSYSAKGFCILVIESGANRTSGGANRGDI